MAHRQVRTGRLRRRLTVAFVLAVALSAGVLAAGSYLLVRTSQLRDSLARAERQARLDLRLGRGRSFEPGGASPEDFVAAYQDRGVDAVLVVDGRRYPSNPLVNPPIPADVRAVAAQGQLAYRRLEITGAPFLVIGGRPPQSTAEIYFLHSEVGIHRDLRFLALVLAGGWAGVVLVAGLTGRALVGRTLEPVAAASRAARSIAEGLLATRLPVGSADEFGAWAASFNEMAEALEAKIRALADAQARERRFTADVSHELRTPITALVGAASLLREHLEAMPPEARRPAELLVEDVARLRRLVEELMEISRLDAGGEQVRLEPVALTSVVEGLLRARGWSDRVALSGDDVTLDTDPRRLERIVDNLVGNAIRHGGREVRVHTGRDGARARLEVTDRGPGIPPDHLSHVFERFYKADPSRTGTGSGLGLAIARENARLLGGDIQVWSAPGEGTRFTVSLPVTEPLHGGESAVTGGAQYDAQAPTEGGGR
ncbi:MAG TPA: HAMP domain-containing sensor histidine kinase [Actinomycetota bacterium]|jgi:two-component system sensor histidine kinase MtrB|nr:HAMP domain-containing sensor histidine kinase [Actinomycetota bacterium]